MRVELQNLCVKYSFCRQNVLLDALQKDVDQVWHIPGHILVLFDSRHSLLAFDVVSISDGPTVTSGSTYEGWLDLTSCSSPIVDVVFLSHTVLVVVHESSRTQAFHYDSRHRRWILLGILKLTSSVHTITVDSVCIHSNSIYWTECLASSQDGSEQLYSLCKRSLPSSVESEWNETSYGAKTVILEQCPRLNIYPTNDSLTIFTSGRGPPGVYMCWVAVGNTLTVHHLDHTMPIYTQANVFCPINYHQLVYSLLTVWSKPCQMAAVDHQLYDPHSKTIYLVGKGNCLFSLNSHQEAVYVVKPGVGELDISPANVVFVTRCILAVISDTDIRYFSIETGDLLTSTPLSNVGCVERTWSTHTSLPSVGILTQQGLYTLQVVGTHKGGMNHIVQLLKQDRLYTGQHQRAHVLDYYKNRTIQETKLTEKILLANGSFQSPALLLALLHQEKESGSVNKQRWNGIIKTLLDTGSQAGHTRLSQILDPLLTEYQHLDSLMYQLMQGVGEVDDHYSQNTVEQDITLLLTDYNQSATVRHAQIHLLTLKSPAAVLQALLDHLNFDEQEDIPSDITQWRHMLQVGPRECDQDIVLFEHICRLLHKYRPQLLVSFVKQAHDISLSTIPSPTYSQHRRSCNVYERALHCLPVVTSSQDPQKAAVATADLHIASGLKQCVASGVQLLLDCQLWQQAIDIVHAHADNSNTHNQLFHRLFTTISKVGMLTQYWDQLLLTLPQCIRSHHLVQMLKDAVNIDKDTTSSVYDNIFVRQPSQAMLSVDSIRPQVEKMLNQKE